jgi:hypothetical protein
MPLYQVDWLMTTVIGGYFCAVATPGNAITAIGARKTASAPITAHLRPNHRDFPMAPLLLE